MLNFRRLDRHHNAGRAAVGLIAPVVFPENAKSLSDRLEKALCGNLNRMLDALRVPACDFACSESHSSNVAVSSFVR